MGHLYRTGENSDEIFLIHYCNSQADEQLKPVPGVCGGPDSGRLEPHSAQAPIQLQRICLSCCWYEYCV